MGKCLQKQLAVAMRVSLWLGVGNGRYWLRLRWNTAVVDGQSGQRGGTPGRSRTRFCAGRRPWWSSR